MVVPVLPFCSLHVPEEPILAVLHMQLISSCQLYCVFFRGGDKKTRSFISITVPLAITSRKRGQ